MKILFGEARTRVWGVAANGEIDKESGEVNCSTTAAEEG